MRGNIGRAALLIALTTLVLVVWLIDPLGTLAQSGAPTPGPTVTPWGGRRGVMPGGLSDIFLPWLISLPLIAGAVAAIVWLGRRRAR